jgi:hypothetical protein
VRQRSPVRSACVTWKHFLSIEVECSHGISETRVRLIQHLTKELGFPWHYIYLPRVARVGNLISKNPAKIAVCPKLSQYHAGSAKSQLNAATDVTPRPANHVFCLGKRFMTRIAFSFLTVIAF